MVRLAELTLATVDMMSLQNSMISTHELIKLSSFSDLKSGGDVRSILACKLDEMKTKGKEIELLNRKFIVNCLCLERRCCFWVTY